MYPAVLLVLGSLAWTSVAQTACSGQQYNDLPGFPVYNGACYPLNYYATSDLGQTSPTDAQSRCQQQCTNAGAQCASVVAQVNKAADSNLYSGTCFFFAPGQTVTPRQCADKAYLLEGYMKDNTLSCFSSSSSAARGFCSSYLSIPLRTSTVTSTPPVKTVTATTTTSPTIITTSTVPATATVISSTTTTTIITPITTTYTATSTSTVTASSTTTQTVTAVLKKRAVAATVPPPACVTSGTPATRLSAACSCLSIQPSTTTSTTTLPQVTHTMTTTSTVIMTSTAPTTVTSATVTTTSTAIATSTATASTTTTTITTTTTTLVSTATATVAAPGPQCNDPNGDISGVGGCSSNCYCDSSESGTNYCTTAVACGTLCTTNADCGSGAFCTTRPDAVAACGGPTCESFTGCTTTYSPSKRDIFSPSPWGVEKSRMVRRVRVDEARRAWDKRSQLSRTHMINGTTMTTTTIV